MGRLIGFMRGRHKVILGLLLPVFVFAVIVLLRPASRPAVVGELSELEVSEIMAAVRQEMWQRAFPDRSWATIRRCPHAFRALATARVIEVNRLFHDRVQVKGRFPLLYRVPVPGILAAELRTNYWTLSRKDGAWFVTGHALILPSEPWQAVKTNPKEDEGFSSTLSNESRLFFDGKQRNGEQPFSFNPSTRVTEQ